MIRRQKVEYFISRSDDPVLVNYTFSKGRPGTMYKKNGDPGDAPEGDEIEVESVVQDGVELQLTTEEREELEEAIGFMEYEEEARFVEDYWASH